MANVYKIYPALNFGVAKHDPGFKTFEELYELAELIRKDKDFSKIHYLFVDLRGCKFCFEASMIKELLELIDKYGESDNQEQEVYIADSPKETAYLLIYCSYESDKRKICSTMKRAYELLKLPVSYHQFEELIDI